MTTDQILTAFRFIAMGRPNHPEVVALAEYLTNIDSEPKEPLAQGLADPFKPASGLSQVIAEDVQDKPKRGRKKAE